jgi:hypothetical protein
VLNGIDGLIASVAGLITAVSGLIGMLVVARRTSPRERDDAARDVLTPSPPPTEAESAAMVEIHKARKRRGRRGR